MEAIFMKRLTAVIIRLTSLMAI